MNQTTISLAHGNGGRLMNQLISEIIAPAFCMNANLTNKDAVEFDCNSAKMITTDGYTVDPLFFPGGDIGKLSVCGTLNDLLVSGSIPEYLTVNFFIEEGFSLKHLQTIVQSMGKIASENHVSIIAGDTKVLPKGSVSGIHIATTGIGAVVNSQLSMDRITHGDSVYVSGSIGDHGTAVMLARETYGLRGSLKSDCQVVNPLAEFLMKNKNIKFMRDPTRGGLATVCHEISQVTKLGIQLFESKIPIKDQVNTFCELLGFSPLYMACEGRIVFISSDEIDISGLNDNTLKVFKIGIVTEEYQNVVIETHLGGINIVPELENEALPRIC